MGSKITSFGKKHVMFVGLSNSGKSTLLYKLKTGEIVETIPTIGETKEHLKIDGEQFTVFDLGGDERIIPNWEDYYKQCEGIVFLIDSTNETDITKSLNLINIMITNEKLKESYILLLFNKIDSLGDFNHEEFINNHHYIFNNSHVHVDFISVEKNINVNGALKWLLDNI